jgi:Sialic acid synthase
MNIFKKYPFLIAEISFNFHTIAQKEDCPYFDVAKLMIEEAKKCGINAVNFHVGDSEFLHCNFEETASNVSDKLSFEDYERLAEFCQEIGILFFITPSDFSDVDALDDFVDAYKIPASDLTNIPFIKHVSAKHKPIILSTAAATLKEIKDAIKSIEEESNFKIVLMHSVLSYPTKLEDANLLMIKDLAEYFNEYDIGYSDYTIPGDNMFVLTTAYNYGAVILEKYFTLDKSLKAMNIQWTLKMSISLD